MPVTSTSSARQDEGANSQSLSDQNPGTEVEITGGNPTPNEPTATSSARQDEGANSQSLTDQNPGNELDI
jgi:hypothetical protein